MDVMIEAVSFKPGRFGARSLIATSNPSVASFCAMALPMPRAAPETKATCEAILK